MFKYFSSLNLLLMLLLTSVLSAKKPTSNQPKLNLDVDISPESGFIMGSAVYIHVNDSVIFLYKSFLVDSVRVDGTLVELKPVNDLNSELSKAYKIPVATHKIEIFYHGSINTVDLPVNISPVPYLNKNLVELANSIDWYPRLQHQHGFAYSLSVKLPDGYQATTNGAYQKNSSNVDATVSQWKSFNTVYNITLLACKDMKKRWTTSKGSTLEIYYQNLADTYVDSMLLDLSEVMAFYKKLYGAGGAQKLVRIVYAPRPAGGYARAPLIVVSENFAIDQRLMKYGFSRDFRLNAHEIAHYWSLANSASADDWINEGLAEFSALMASRTIIGEDFYKILMDEYLGIVTHTNTGVSILETNAGSWEREINRYYKPTIMFDSLWVKYGYEKFSKFTNVWYNNSVKKGFTNTSILTDCLNQVYGSEVKDVFLSELNQKTLFYMTPESVSQNNYPALEGKWSGPLTQFGSTVNFVLNLKMVDNSLLPTLDSPDQGAFDIPVNDFEISGAEISFTVNAASGKYTGKIQPGQKTIIGTWSQRGADYPLNMKKQ